MNPEYKKKMDFQSIKVVKITFFKLHSISNN